jgi:hypothetical protein
MKTIITPVALLRYIFAAGENYNASMVTEADIAIAESRYLTPILGETLYNKLLTGGYTELMNEYVAPMLGAWVRYNINPFLSERCGLGHGTESVDDTRQLHLKSAASSLSHRLSDYLNAHYDSFPEYNPCDNPLNHCSIDGNIVQIY